MTVEASGGQFHGSNVLVTMEMERDFLEGMSIRCSCKKFGKRPT